MVFAIWAPVQTKHKIIANGEASEDAEVLSGIPRGTVLGSILFLFINDIASNMNGSIRLFADNCLLYREIDSSEDMLYSNRT